MRRASIRALYGSTEAEPIACIDAAELAACRDLSGGLPDGRLAAAIELDGSVPASAVPAAVEAAAIPHDFVRVLPTLPRDPRHRSKIDYGALVETLASPIAECTRWS